MLALLGGDVWGTNPQFPAPPHQGETVLSPSPAPRLRGLPPSYLGARRRSHPPLSAPWARRWIHTLSPAPRARRRIRPPPQALGAR